MLSCIDGTDTDTVAGSAKRETGRGDPGAILLLGVQKPGFRTAQPARNNDQICWNLSETGT